MSVNKVGFKELYFADSYMSPLFKGRISQFFKWMPVIWNRFFHLMMHWSIVTDYRLAKHVIAHTKTPTELSDLKVLEEARKLLERNRMNQELNNAVVELEGRVKKIDEQKMQIEQLQYNMHHASFLQANRDQQVVNAHAEVYKLKAALAGSQSAYDTLQNQLAITRYQQNQLQSTYAQKEHELHAKQAQFNHLQHTLSQKTHEVAVKVNEISQLKSQLSQKEHEATDKGIEIGQINGELLRKKQEVTDQGIEIGRIKGELLRKEQEVRDQGIEIGRIKGELLRKEQEVKDQGIEIGRIKGELLRKEQEVRDQGLEISRIKGDLLLKEKEITDKGLEIDRIIKERDAFQVKFNQEHRSLLIINSDLESKKSDLEKTKSEVESTKSLLSNSENEVRRLTKNVDDKVKEFNQLKSSFREVEGKLDNANETILQLQKKQSQNTSSSKVEINSEIEELKRKIDTLKKEKSTLLSNIDDLKSNLEKSERDLENERSIFTNTLEQLNHKTVNYNKLYDEYKELVDLYRELKQKFDHAEIKLELANNELEQVKKSSESLSSELGILKRNQVILQLDFDRLKQDEKDLNTKYEQLLIELKTTKESLAQVTLDLEQKKILLDASKKDTDLLKYDMEQKNDQLNVQKNEIQKLGYDLNGKKNKINELIIQLNSFKDLQTQCDLLMMENSNLNQGYEIYKQSATRELGLSEEKNKILQAENEKLKSELQKISQVTVPLISTLTPQGQTVTKTDTMDSMPETRIVIQSGDNQQAQNLFQPSPNLTQTPSEVPDLPTGSQTQIIGSPPPPPPFKPSETKKIPTTNVVQNGNGVITGQVVKKVVESGDLATQLKEAQEKRALKNVTPIEIPKKVIKEEKSEWITQLVKETEKASDVKKEEKENNHLAKSLGDSWDKSDEWDLLNDIKEEKPVEDPMTQSGWIRNDSQKAVLLINSFINMNEGKVKEKTKIWTNSKNQISKDQIQVKIDLLNGFNIFLKDRIKFLIAHAELKAQATRDGSSLKLQEPKTILDNLKCISELYPKMKKDFEKFQNEFNKTSVNKNVIQKSVVQTGGLKDNPFMKKDQTNKPSATLEYAKEEFNVIQAEYEATKKEFEFWELIAQDIIESGGQIKKKEEIKKVEVKEEVKKVEDPKPTNEQKPVERTMEQKLIEAKKQVEISETKALSKEDIFALILKKGQSIQGKNQEKKNDSDDSDVSDGE